MNEITVVGWLDNIPTNILVNVSTSLVLTVIISALIFEVTAMKRESDRKSVFLVVMLAMFTLVSWAFYLYDIGFWQNFQEA